MRNDPLSANLLLSSLSLPAHQALMEHCTPVPLPLRTSLYKPEQIPQYAYFMTSGMASIVTAMSDGTIAEVEIVGREGVVGGMHLLGPASVVTSCFMQIEGTGLRIEYPRLQDLFRANTEIRARILEYVQEQTLVVSQIAGCNRLHSAEQRLALWLLMASDRTSSDMLNITQEFLAEMIGTRRTTVTAIATILQRKDLMKYQRGRIRITNRADLEATACYCYQVIRNLHDCLYRDASHSNGHVAPTARAAPDRA
jgi:CRP-like cAMP-binding protein